MLRISCFALAGGPTANAKEQALLLRLRFQACDLICRHDLNLWLPVAKSDCTRNADGFSLDDGQPLIGCYRGGGCNESGELFDWGSLLRS